MISLLDRRFKVFGKDRLEFLRMGLNSRQKFGYRTPALVLTQPFLCSSIGLGGWPCGVAVRNDGAYQPLSEHALANALDISDFVLDSGEQIAVVENWPKGPVNPPLPVPNPSRVSSETFKVQRVSVSRGDRKRDFLEFVHDEACKTFGTVLGPDAMKLTRVIFISI